MPPPGLLAAIPSDGHVHLVLGANPLASARCSRSLAAGATPVVVASPPAHGLLHSGLAQRVEAGQVRWLQRRFDDADVTTLGRADVDGVVDAVFVTEGTQAQSAHVSKLCRRLRIPVNVVDAPSLSSFTLLAVHADGPLHIGVTASGCGCKMAARIRREVAALLPSGIGHGMARLGTLRRRIGAEDWGQAEDAQARDGGDGGDGDEDAGQSHDFNQLVISNDREKQKSRRMRWLSQICEHWPLDRIARFSDDDVDALLRDYTAAGGLQHPSPVTDDSISSSHSLSSPAPPPSPKPPTITLAGAGPGHPSLLTLAAYRAMQTANVVLADKLTPAPILALVPRRTPIHIARKFPGNADAAQDELLELGLAALRAGRSVVRVKGGDPFVFGRAGEELAFFARHGFAAAVVPGVSSALAAPAAAAIPVTMRGVADRLVVCSGTARAGAVGGWPPFDARVTLVLLMVLHRLPGVVAAMLAPPPAAADHGPAYPPDTPCAVVERATCPDQRVVRTSLRHVCAAVAELGSRPPGLLIVGGGCRVLFPSPASADAVADAQCGMGAETADAPGVDITASTAAAGASPSVVADAHALVPDLRPAPAPAPWIVHEGFRGLDGLGLLGLGAGV